MKHLLSMLTILAACHSSPGPAAPTAAVADLAARRAQMIQWLHEYYEAGVYPTDASGMPLSVFKDDKGVRCPMAELIHRSGHDDLVEAVAREDNGVRLADVKEGPLYDWMLSSGLTQEEIAMVQGAMDIDYTWMREAPNQETILARGEVRGRLETAERALVNATSNGLTVAAGRLPAGRVPVVAEVRGNVVPAVAKKRPAPRQTLTVRFDPNAAYQLGVRN